MTQETTTTYHIPVLLTPAVDGLDIRPDGTYVDVTLGGGGHTREILRRLGPDGRLLGFDQDEDAERNIPDDPRFTFVRSNFRYLHNFLRYHGIRHIDPLRRQPAGLLLPLRRRAGHAHEQAGGTDGGRHREHLR